MFVICTCPTCKCKLLSLYNFTIKIIFCYLITGRKVFKEDERFSTLMNQNFFRLDNIELNVMFSMRMRSEILESP